MTTEDWNNVICVDDWDLDESSYESGLYPEGAREKMVLFSPSDVGELPLRPSWRYLLKKSRSWAHWQFWMEVMAYRIGQIMDVPVPPAYVGLRQDPTTDAPSYGALIEWFYGPNESYIPGSNLIAPLSHDFNYKTGKPHNLQTIVSIFAPPHLTDDTRRTRLNHWAIVLAFDAVIGNTDRHPENWGIVAPFASKGASPDPLKIRLSPAFDNGTAMSYEQREEGFPRFQDERYVARYLSRAKKARHHMGWDSEDSGPVCFFDFMRRFASAYPETRPAILEKLEFKEGDLRTRLEPLVLIDVEEEARLTKSRLDFTIRLIMKRTALLKAALEE